MRRLRSLPWSARLATLFVTVVAVFALFGSFIAPGDVNTQDLSQVAARPSGDHLLGTDLLGRDVLAATVVGTRMAILGPLAIALGALVLGGALGLVAGYKGGTADALVLRLTDFINAFPALLVVVVVTGVLGGGYWKGVALLVVLFVPYEARIVRGVTLQKRSLPYVEAAKLLGVRDRRIMATEVWPNIAPYSVANGLLNFGLALATLGALSFLGLGAGPQQPEWGRMLYQSRLTLFANPFSALAPGAALVGTAIAVNILGEVVFERFALKGR